MEIKYDPDVWFSPRYAICNLWALIKEDGENIKKLRNYQKEREAWIVGIVLLGVKKLYGNLWWLKIPIDDPPDILAMAIASDDNNNQNILNEREVEVMEFTNYSKGTLIEEILNKMRNKFYNKKTALVVYLRKDMRIEDMRILSKQLATNDLRIADIWVIGNTNPTNNEFILFSLLPEVMVVKFDVDQEISTLLPGDTIKMFKGKGTRMEKIKSTVTKFNPRSSKQLAAK